MRLCWVIPIKTAARVMLITTNSPRKTPVRVMKTLTISPKNEFQKKQGKEKEISS